MSKMLYIGQGRRRPKGWLLAHNDIRHGKNTRNGVNCFRYFWIASREGSWKLCRCGWRPDLGPHYSKNPKRELLKRVREEPPPRRYSAPRRCLLRPWLRSGRPCQACAV